MTEKPVAQVHRGQILFTASPEKFSAYENGYIVVEEGKVKGVTRELPREYREVPLADWGDRLIIPGFVDLHLHAPQFPNAGLGQDMELLPWLETYTFPEEMKYRDAEYAKKVYSRFVDELWLNGTTRAVVFATIHQEATELLYRLFESRGLGAFVGKVNMDRNCPDALKEKTRQSLAATRAYLENHREKTSLVKPIITPRFVPTSTADSLEGLGKLAAEFQVPVQSHLCENIGEILWVEELHPEQPNYARVYNAYGLFGQQPTVMAHCVHCSDEEVELIKKNRVFVAHCPHSNLNLSSGIMPVRHYLDLGIDVGLGSDISGGHKVSMFGVMAVAQQVSKIKWLESEKKYAPLTTAEVFYLATKGGGKFFGKVGSFEEGYEFDALIIDDSNLFGDGLTLEERIQRLLYLGDDRNIVERYVAGRKNENPRI
jgi:guanine deaminase